MGALDVSDIELGRRVGETRQTIHRKKTGRSALTADNIDDYAAALGIEPEVLMRRPSAALVWLAEHRADELDGQAPGKTERANTGDDQGDHGAITHRRRVSP
ncbi:MAG: helix-turn-helix transcriptional regulator [Acidimicrobiales bacterium]